MKRQTQSSVLKWSSLLAQRQVTSLVDIQNTSILITLLNRLQPQTFNQLYEIDERSSNSIQSILKFINQYYKKHLNCNITPITQNLNIFKSPVTLWQLLIGVAIKGKNRDANINVILQMQPQEQSQLMLLVQDVIEKLSEYDCVELGNNGREEVSDSSEDNRRRKQSNFSMINGRNQYVNQLIEENQGLRQLVNEVQMEMQQNKLICQQQKKVYQERLNHFKAQRYQFLQVLTGGNVKETRSRAQSSYKFRQSLASSQSKIMEDPLQGINVPVTGSLGEIAQEMLNTFKMMKREEGMHLERVAMLEEHNKDLKLAVDKLVEEVKEKDEEMMRLVQLEREVLSVKEENEELLRNETELLKIIREVEQQKQYLRDTVEKLKQQKQQLIMNNQQSANTPPPTLTPTNTLTPNSHLTPNPTLNIMKAPSMLLRQMASQLQPSEPQQLNSLLEDAKNPLLKEKYERQLEQLKVKYNETREQNRELKQVNKMLQKTIHESMQKSGEIQRCIEEGYRELFGESGEGGGNEANNDKVNNQNDQNNNKEKHSEDKQANQQKQQDQNSPIQIRISHQSLISHTKPQPPTPTPTPTPHPNPKLHTFYQNIKQIIQSYQQQQLLLIIEIQSLRKQLNDLVEKRIKQGKGMGQEKGERIKQGQKQLGNEHKDKGEKEEKTKRQEKQFNDEGHNNSLLDKIDKRNRYGHNFEKKSTLQNIQHHHLTQSQPLILTKEQSQLHFAINISAPGTTCNNPQSQKLQHISYHISNSHIGQKESQSMQQSQHFRQPDEGNEPKVTVSVKPERNRQAYPSEQFIEIQEGEELTDSDIPRFIPKQKESEEQEQEKNEDEHQVEEEKGNRNLGNQLGMLGVDNNVGNGRSMLMASGIGLRWSKEQRKSFFAKSGFYNQSFIELTNRLNSQIHEELQELTFKAQSKSNEHHPTFPPIQPSNFPPHPNHPFNQPQQQTLPPNLSPSTLLTRLQKIKLSSDRIRQLHLKQSTAVQSQLKQSFVIEQSQLTKLKLSNELLKQHLTKVTGCLSSISDKVRHVNGVMENVPNLNEVNVLLKAVKEVDEVVERLAEVLPEIEHDMEQSKVMEVQMMYHAEKTKREQLQEEIQVLLQTIVCFRNLAILQDYAQ